jgi:Ca2+-dependent lipid-binding protein
MAILLAAGVVSLLLPQARNLDASGTHSGHLSPFAKIYLGYVSDGSDNPVLVTEHQHHSLHPTWNAKHDFYCPSREACVISLQVIDDHTDKSIIGHLSLQLDDLLDGNKTGVEWWPMSGCRTGEVMMHAVWRPLNLHSY